MLKNIENINNCEFSVKFNTRRVEKGRPFNTCLGCTIMDVEEGAVWTWPALVVGLTH